jgi:glycosyltransferase involved in cell wall biosynthesis
VLSQTVDDIEVIVTDDDSSDDTTAIVEARARDDARITLHRNPQRLGLAGNWNRSVALARGEWVKFVFQDDTIAPTCLERMLDGASSEWPLVACGRAFLFEDVEPAAREQFEIFTAALAPERLFGGGERVPAEDFRTIALDHLGFNFVGEPTAVLLHRSVFDRYGTFDERLVEICDLQYWLRVGSDHGLRFVHEDLAVFRVHAGATTARNQRDHAFRTDLDQLVLLHDIAFDPRFEALRSAARRHPEGSARARFTELAVDSWARAQRLAAAGDPAALETWRSLVERYPRLRRSPRVQVRSARRRLGDWRTARR